MNTVTTAARIAKNPKPTHAITDAATAATVATAATIAMIATVAMIAMMFIFFLSLCTYSLAQP